MTLPPTALPATTLEDDERAAQRRLRRRRNLIVALRIAVLVVVLGGWELAARLKWIDPFFFSMPSLIFEQIQDWFVNGTSQGPLLTQVWVTLEETAIGFVIGSVAGVICGIVLGRNKLMADVFGLYIQIANSIPRVVLGSVFVIALGLGMASKIALAVVMVFFVVFGNAFQGVREADRYLIANAQILRAELDSREPARELRLRAGRCGGRRIPRLQAGHRAADLHRAGRVQRERCVRGDDRAGRGRAGRRLPADADREAPAEMASRRVLSRARPTASTNRAGRPGAVRH